MFGTVMAMFNQDRSKDIIISGGENISSIEAEDALYKHPDVVAVCVVAKQDEKWVKHLVHLLNSEQEQMFQVKNFVCIVTILATLKFLEI